jgi:hypothetical protein
LANGIIELEGGAKWLLDVVSAEEKELRTVRSVVGEAKSKHGGQLTQMLGGGKTVTNVEVKGRYPAAITATTGGLDNRAATEQPKLQ